MSASGGTSVLLLDTHVLIWFSTDNPRLSRRASEAIASPDNRLFVSAITAWEYSDLHGRGRLGPIGMLETPQRALDFDVLDFPAELWCRTAQLPQLHRDPVDRILIAHAMFMDLTLVSADRTVRQYPVATLW